MRGVVAVALASLVSLGMSGCFVADDDPEAQADAAGSIPAGSTSATKSATGSKSGTGTSTVGSTTANRAPTADLAATPLNGTAPLNVTFSINGTDADGDGLTWSLTAGTTLLTNGTTLPANFTQTFSAGNHTVVLVVSDGRLNATANVTVVVEDAVAAEPPAAAGPNICEAPSETSIGGGMYVDRTSWVFLESNDLPGLQYTEEPSLIGEVDAAGVGCENGDTLLF